jgi:hypothetical protein
MEKVLDDFKIIAKALLIDAKNRKSSIIYEFDK